MGNFILYYGSIQDIFRQIIDGTDKFVRKTNQRIYYFGIKTHAYVFRLDNFDFIFNKTNRAALYFSAMFVAVSI